MCMKVTVQIGADVGYKSFKRIWLITSYYMNAASVIDLQLGLYVAIRCGQIIPIATAPLLLSGNNYQVQVATKFGYCNAYRRLSLHFTSLIKSALYRLLSFLPF